MDEWISNFVKFLSSTVVVRIMSYPNFAIEILLASVVCIVNFLLLFEINTLVRRTNAKAAARLRLKRPNKESNTSFHSLASLQNTQLVQKKPEFSHRSAVYAPFSLNVQKRYSPTSFGWMLSKGDSVMGPSFSDRVEHLLSISPSEYVRRDKERKSNEQGLRCCIQSLTSLLEKALNNKQDENSEMPAHYIENSFNVLRDNYELQLRDDALLMELVSASMQNIIDRNKTRTLLWDPVSPKLFNAGYQSPNVKFSKSNIGMSPTEIPTNQDEETRNNNLNVKSSRSFSEIFRKHSVHFADKESKHSRGVLAN